MTSPQSLHPHTDNERPYIITPVTTPEDLNDITVLFRDYATSLGIDLSFQDFAAELAGLPGRYAPPTGSLLLARRRSGGPALGCVGLRRLGDQETCEMKRLYVAPRGRGTGLGRALAVEALDRAREMGYHRIRLDTLGSMTSARALYEKLGFSEVGPYYATPLEDTRFMELALT